MKIAIAATAPYSAAPVSEYGGRAPVFLVFTSDGELLETLTNPYSEEKELVGIKVADLFSEKSIDLFVSGEIGSRMREALGHRNIQCLERSGRVQDVFEEVLAEGVAPSLVKALS